MYIIRHVLIVSQGVKRIHANRPQCRYERRHGRYDKQYSATDYPYKRIADIYMNKEAGKYRGQNPGKKQTERQSQEHCPETAPERKPEYVTGLRAKRHTDACFSGSGGSRKRRRGIYCQAGNKNP